MAGFAEAAFAAAPRRLAPGSAGACPAVSAAGSTAVPEALVVALFAMNRT
jgi:hypothetical protein